MLQKTLRAGDRLIIGDVEIECSGAGRRSLGLRINSPEAVEVVHEKPAPKREQAEPRRLDSGQYGRTDR